jgi:hypothetical protein
VYGCEGGGCDGGAFDVEKNPTCRACASANDSAVGIGKRRGGSTSNDCAANTVSLGVCATSGPAIAPLKMAAVSSRVRVVAMSRILDSR